MSALKVFTAPICKVVATSHESGHEAIKILILSLKCKVKSVGRNAFYGMSVQLLASQI